MISEHFYENTIVISIHGSFDDRASHELLPTVRRAYRMGFQEFVFNLKAVTRIVKKAAANFICPGSR